MAKRLSFVLLAAESPDAEIEETVGDDKPERGRKLRSDWRSVSRLLRLGSAIDTVEASVANLDPWRSADHCEPAAAYSDVEHAILCPYFAALARFQLVWNAYELIRESSAIGSSLKSGSLQSSSICSFDYFPCLREMIYLFDSTWISEPHPYRDVGPPCFIKKEYLEKRVYGGPTLAWSGLALNAYRNYIFHGDEEPPSPDDSFDHFGGKPPLREPVKTRRLNAAAGLAMVMVFAFASDWLPEFYAATTADDENLFLVDVDYDASDAHQVLLQLARSIFIGGKNSESTTLL